MKQENIERLSNAKVGDKVETKKWIYTVHWDKEGYRCSDCCLHLKPASRRVCCLAISTVDSKCHYFTRERKESV